ANVSLPAPPLIGPANIDLLAWAQCHFGRILVSNRGIARLVVHPDWCGKRLPVGRPLQHHVAGSFLALHVSKIEASPRIRGYEGIVPAVLPSHSAVLMGLSRQP